MNLLYRIYSVMLRAYPESFRRRFGNEMGQAFRSKAREVLHARSSVTIFFLQMIADWVTSVFRERISEMLESLQTRTSKRWGGGIVLRIAIWAGTGALVSRCWGLYFAVADKGSPIEPIVYALAFLTQPAAAIARLLEFPVGLHSVIEANAATYGMVGAVVETIRRHFSPAA